MSGIYNEINNLIEYGLKNELLEIEDVIYTRNKMLEILKLYDFKEENKETEEKDLEDILNNILKWAVKNGLIEDNITEKDLLDTKIMGALMPRPSEVIKEFYKKYNKEPALAMNYYYNLSTASNYIRLDRIKKDLKWKTKTEYGSIDITINMSKPEKDPKEIAKVANTPQSAYPRCVLCKECEGYEGRFNYPSRSNHRIIPLELNKEQWFLQYSPYLYFNQHLIVLNSKHTSMKINRNTFIKLLDFVSKFKDYFIGSNADLPIVGGSILSHDHYQGGLYKFPIEEADIEETYVIEGFKEVEVQKIKWPLTVIRLIGSNREELIDLSDKILRVWRGYSDEDIDINAYTGEVPHNTITPIARFKNGKYEMDLVLRNNRCTEQYPLGIFHPHENLHHIKKENIGLIEVMGLAVLPARLTSEIKAMKNYLLYNEYSKEIESHKVWLDFILEKRGVITIETVDDVIKEEIGLVFKEVLIDCGVFKLNEKGAYAFNKFIRFLNNYK